MKHARWVLSALILLVGLGAASAAPAKKKPSGPALKPAAVVGRWNLTVAGPDGTPFPSWLEITSEGDTLSGRLCGRTGSAHPLARVALEGPELVFADAVEHQGAKTERVYRAKVKRGRMEGTATITVADGTAEPGWTFEGAKAPKLREPSKLRWGKPLALINKGLSGWRLRNDKHGACWTEVDGVLTNSKPCVDIISDGKYENFKLHLEFKLTEKSNSGVYLRGRYEVQINDDHGKASVGLHGMGGLYGLIEAKENAAKAAGEWQTYDITVLGRRLTVELNGVKVIDGQEIPGPTGGALDSEEALPGPLMLQGDHGVVSFRNIVLTPAL